MAGTRLDRHTDSEWLRMARETMKLDQGQLGQLLGITQASVSHYETGRNRRLPMLTRREVVRLLSLSAAKRAALLEETADKKRSA